MGLGALRPFHLPEIRAPGQGGQRPARVLSAPDRAHVGGGRIWILDLDPLHCGDPAHDLAMVHLVLGRLGRERAVPRTRPLYAHFLATYFRQAPPGVAARVPLNAALIHLKRACKRLRWRSDPGWSEEVALEVERAEGYLEPRRKVPAHGGAGRLVELLALA